MSRRIARVLLDSPLPQLDRLFDYALPEGIADQAAPGVRVRVPLRTAGRIVDAFVIETDDETDDDRALSEVDAVVSAAQVLPPRLHRLARAVADRAAGTASDVIRLVVPKRQVRVEKAWLAGAAAEAPEVSAGALAAAHEALDAYSALTTILDEGGRAAVEAIPHIDQDGVLAWMRLMAAAAAQTMAQGRSSILVVPDHRDLDRLRSVLSTMLPDEAVVRVDARQPGPARYRAFLRTLEQAPCVVIGNRSAVYAPVDAGLVAIWDDGDSLLSEPLAPYVHARDAALVRQGQEGSALLLIGHSRTTDAERLVRTGWLEDVRATRRTLPTVVLTPPAELERRTERVSSGAFRAAREAVASGPVLVQVARPGFAPSLVCGACRAPARCASCGGPLGAARHGAVPTCGWCGRTARDWACPACASTAVRLSSSGSERTADELGRAFPGTRVIVADGTHPLDRVDPVPALVIATRGAEPVVDGGYHAVILLDGARMLQAPDLRVGESCLRWWSNAAALAAPGAPVHLVGVDGPAARALATWNHPRYAAEELASRAPLHMPPSVRVALIEGTSAAIGRVRAAIDELPLPSDALLGPVPIDDEGVRHRILLRFPYAEGTAVAGTLRAVMVTEAAGRRGPRGRTRAATLSVRLDVLDPEL